MVGGSSIDGQLNYVGFLSDGTSYETLDLPDSTLTQVQDIDGDLVTGSFKDETGVDHGFIYDRA